MIRLAVAARLDEHRASPLTHGACAAELRRFRAALQRAGLDLDADYALVALLAQAWEAARAPHGRAPASGPIDVERYTSGAYGDLFRAGGDTSDLDVAALDQHEAGRD